jgi:hypothetical protein
VAGQGGKTVGKTYNQLDKRLHGLIAAQHIFFVATAPQRPGGHVNLSPKGHADTFAVLDERTVAYLDLTGSGAETAAHLRDDGRITLMFCAFSGAPQILRLYEQGRIVLPGEQRWDELAAWFPARGARAVVVGEIEWIAGSCRLRGPHSTTTPRSATYSTSGFEPGRGRAGRLPRPSTTAGASTASPLCPLPPVTGRQLGLRGGLSSCLNAAGMLPADHSRGPDRRHVEA